MATYQTIEEQLVAVQAAIQKAQNAQSYGVAGRSVQRASLETLYKREKELKAALLKSAQGGASGYSYFLHE